MKAPINLQDLRRRLYVKAKAEPSWRFWGLYVHVCKRETLLDAYRSAKANNGAPGIDGVTFEAISLEDFPLSSAWNSCNTLIDPCGAARAIPKASGGQQYP